MTQQQVTFFYDKIQYFTTQLAQEAQISHIDALIEVLENLQSRTVQVTDGQPAEPLASALRDFIEHAQWDQLTVDEQRKILQLVTLHAQRADEVQTNHQLTPDGIGFLLGDLILQTSQSVQPVMTDLTTGTGNLLQTVSEILERDERHIQAAYGFDNDDTQLALAAINDALIARSDAHFYQTDVVAQEMTPTSDIVIGDVPVGYYPLTPSQTYQTRQTDGKSLVHQLLIEKSLQALKEDGWAYIIVPAMSLTGEQAKPLMQFLNSDAVQLRAFLSLPVNFFKNKAAAKAILVLQKGSQPAREVLVGQYPDLKDIENLKKFLQEIKEWAKIEE
jgi:site-specific DNA-methyltransferase (adenine-specific)